MFGRKKNSVIEPKAGEQYITMNEGLSSEYKVKVLKRLPKDWTPIKGALTAPRGYIWVSNNKSLFGGKRKSALVKDKKYHKLFPSEAEQPKIMSDSISEANKAPIKRTRREAVTQADLNCSVQNFMKVKELLKSGEARNLAFRKPMKFYREHSVDQAVKLLKEEASAKKYK
ncbi:MAG: hypothetical protein K2I30_05575 [Clostridia bacterium]|nr:hypothetical protein [Clostridia bacterium]